jgi:FkbM family methyltransferase
VIANNVWPMPPPVPPSSRKSWGRVRASLGSFAQMAGWRARLTLLGAKLSPRIGGGQGVVTLPVKELGGRPLHVRPGTPDMNTIFLDYVQGAHLPPPPFVRRDLRQICELGSQIGTGIAGLAARYPRARVIGVEPDPLNAVLARRNVEAFGARCEVVETAIWDSEADLTVEGEWVSGFTVRPSTEADPPERRVRATTVDRLLAKRMPDGQIDYLVMNLERTEPRILAAGSTWAPRVASIRVEIYPGRGFEGDEAVALLERLGFEAWWEPLPSNGFAFGVRRDR